MASPEQGQSPLDQATGSWIGFNLTIPDFLAPVREAIDSVAQLLIAILNIILAVLDIIKAFTLAFLDPLIALIEALIALIEQFVNDLRNAGFYLHGDWYLLKEGPEFRNLLGGYQAYERRMIQRLIDPRDPNRPVLSPSSVVIALFFYASADGDSFMRVINFIRGILTLFARGGSFPGRSLGTVTNVQASYGVEGIDNVTGATKTLFGQMIQRQQEGIPAVSQAAPPNIVTLKWQLAGAPGNFVSPIAPLLPNGFFIEISTEPNPLYLQYDIVPKGQQVTSGTGSAIADPPNRVRGLCVDEQGRTFLVNGGIDMFDIQGEFFDVQGANPRVFAFKTTADQDPIPLSELKKGDDYLLQRTIYVSPLQAGGITPGQALSYTLTLDDMPKLATFENGKAGNIEETDTFYVRIRPVSSNIKSTDDFKFQITSAVFNRQTVPVKIPVDPVIAGPEKTSILDRGEASAPLKITFPNANTEDYLKCVFTALIVMALSRPDLQQVINNDNGLPIEEFDPDIHSWAIFSGHAANETGLEDLAKTLLPQFTGRKVGNQKYWNGESSPVVWREQAYNRLSALTNRLFRDNNPPRSIQKLVVETCQDLLNFTLGDFVDDGTSELRNEVVEALGDRSSIQAPNINQVSNLTLINALLDGDIYAGLALNPWSLGTNKDDTSALIRQFRSDLNSAVLPDPYPPGFYSTSNDAQIQAAEARQALAQQAGGDLVAELDAAGLDSSAETLRTSLEDPAFVGAASPNRIVRGSVLNSPVIYVRRGTQVTKLTFCRNAFDANIYNQAAFALQIALGPVNASDGGWITARLGQLLPDIDQFLDEILAWIKALAAALDSIAKAIRRFIEYLQARIIELQILIQRINAILQNLFRLFSILPAGFILPVVEQGTTGVLRSLVTAQDKPFDGPNFYGGGVVVLASAGPLFPSFFLDIFAGD